LFQKPQNHSGLQDFKSRFEARLKEMVYDIEEKVAVAAVSALYEYVFKSFRNM
jgi:hypothetical protein